MTPPPTGPRPTVVLTVSGDRPGYLAETLASWEFARGLDAWRFGFVVEPGAEVERCREVITAFAGHGVAADTEVVVNERRFGVRANPHRALSWAFGTGAPFVVLAEEDIVVGDDVLEFVTDRSAVLADDPSVLAVCAFSPLEAPQAADTVGDGVFSAWVWGTWEDRWRALLDPRWFDAAVGPAPGVEEGFDFGIPRIAAAEGMRIVRPHASRSDNIGREGGVHALPEEFEESRAATFAAHREPVHFRDVPAVG